MIFFSKSLSIFTLVITNEIILSAAWSIKFPLMDMQCQMCFYICIFNHNIKHTAVDSVSFTSCVWRRKCVFIHPNRVWKDKEIRINFIPVIEDGLIPSGTPEVDVFLSERRFSEPNQHSPNLNKPRILISSSWGLPFYTHCMKSCQGQFAFFNGNHLLCHFNYFDVLLLLILPCFWETIRKLNVCMLGLFSSLHWHLFFFFMFIILNKSWSYQLD